MVLKNLRKVSTRDAQLVDCRELVDLWRDNHQTMLKYALAGEIPYFGLHATNTQRLQQIISESGGPTLFWATFYDKGIDEFKLYQLYAVTGYISRFLGSNYEKRGGILVLNFEGEDGRNVSIPRKRLKGVGNLEVQLTFDDERVREVLSKLGDANRRNKLWVQETQRGCYGDFRERYLGTVIPSNLRENVEDYAKKVALRRLDYQYNLANVFDLVKAKNITVGR